MIYIEVIIMNEENEIIQQEFVPSPKWKRVLAWIMFAIVCIGIVCWLLGIAFPTWPEAVKDWLK